VLAAAAAAGQFTLSSPDIAPGGRIAEAQVFDGFGCKGGNVSPALAWSNVPEGTRSFALMVHDPDAPTGSGWWHWLVYNIPAGTSSLAAGAGDAH
jgi:Raf kinase inhibitor-like YbhB/YbcL family protein